MKIYLLRNLLVYMVSVLLLAHCRQKPDAKDPLQNEVAAANYGGFESQAKWGEHIVTISGCHDCHSPKKMTAHGPDIDSTLLLSGHPALQPPPDVNRKELETKGLVLAAGDLTSWVGPWGISFTANLTSDVTGIGNWSEEQFMYALREGKFKGLAGSRSLLPPMPWPMYKHMTDDEMKAVFAYLKSTKPINNVVPAPVPPASAQQK
ncbi:MAG TPA: c-type cytochrome [Ferruginibacter sp.]|nr:c-type cytochrome [Ferruginibacter sp.]